MNVYTCIHIIYVLNISYIYIIYALYVYFLGGFPGGSMAKNLPAKQEMWVRFLSWEDPLEKEMATHSGILTWEIPWTEEPGGLQSMESHRVGHGLATKQQQ